MATQCTTKLMDWHAAQAIHTIVKNVGLKYTLLIHGSVDVQNTVTFALPLNVSIVHGAMHYIMAHAFTNVLMATIITWVVALHVTTAVPAAAQTITLATNVHTATTTSMKATSV